MESTSRGIRALGRVRCGVFPVALGSIGRWREVVKRRYVAFALMRSRGGRCGGKSYRTLAWLVRERHG